MLVLSRKPGQSVVIGQDIEIQIIESRGARVKLGFTAPEKVPIRRAELPCKPQGRLSGRTELKSADP